MNRLRKVDGRASCANQRLGLQKRSSEGYNTQQKMRILALVLTVALITYAGCTASHRLGASPSASAAVTDLGTIAVNDHDWYQCTLSGDRICRVRLTAIPNSQVVVEVVILRQDAQGQPQRILARARTEADLGKKVSLAISEGSVSLTPEIKPRAQKAEAGVLSVAPP